MACGTKRRPDIDQSSTSGRRTALITGASAGLGEEFAHQLAERGIDLVLVARRREKLEQLSARLTTNFDVSASVVEADLSQPTAPRQLYESMQAQGQTIDYLINNAGAGGPDLLEHRAWADIAEYFELMMLSVAQMCHRFVPDMCERGFGRIINVASVAGLIARRGDVSYGPSKAYVVALSEALDLTLKHANVRCTALCPGFTHTKFHEVAGALDMKARSPKFLWYDSAVVVADGLRAVEKGRRVYVSGRLYRVIDRIGHFSFIRLLRALGL